MDSTFRSSLSVSSRSNHFPQLRQALSVHSDALSTAMVRLPAIHGPAIRGPEIRGPEIREPAIREPDIREQGAAAAIAILLRRRRGEGNRENPTPLPHHRNALPPEGGAFHSNMRQLRRERLPFSIPSRFRRGFSYPVQR